MSLKKNYKEIFQIFSKFKMKINKNYKEIFHLVNKNFKKMLKIIK
jgi:hypothetical protein